MIVDRLVCISMYSKYDDNYLHTISQLVVDWLSW